MKWILAVFATVLIFACVNSDLKYLENAIPDGVDLNDYPQALAEIKARVKECGKGVIEGVKGKNSCGDKITIDADFLMPIKDKTGLISDSYWAFRDGVVWISATDEEMADVPEAWDLKDECPVTDIHRQRCGDCWSTSSRKLLEQAVACSTGEAHPKLSAQTTLSNCCRKCGSCSGGYMWTPSWFSKDGDANGLPFRQRDPYLGVTSRCKFSTDELQNEMDFQLDSAPYVGSSLQQSRFHRGKPESPKVENTMALMLKYKSNALVTISALSQSSGVYTGCSNVNSGGNHMQNIVGWYPKGNYTIARVQNSWGTYHGTDGYTHLRWECGKNRLNRGLGRRTRVGVFQPTCGQIASNPIKRSIVKSDRGERLILGAPSKVKGQSCTWAPKIGIGRESADGCEVQILSSEKSVEYHVTATEPNCNSIISAMTLVQVEGATRLVTPLGEIAVE